MQDVAQVVAHVLTGEGKHGFSDKHRGQLIVLTGKSEPYKIEAYILILNRTNACYR